MFFGVEFKAVGSDVGSDVNPSLPPQHQKPKL